METNVCANCPSDWKIRSLADICTKVTSGGTPSRRSPGFYLDGQWPWVKTQELQDTWIDDTEEHITDEAIAQSSAKILPSNTILLAMYGATVGQLGLVRRPMTCNQACCALIVDPKEANFRFVFYQLLNARRQLQDLATGAAQQNLSGVLIKSLRFPYPSLSHQNAIADLLGSIDDKIQLNRKMAQTLEDIARAIFKDWFVQFAPAHAKQRGEASGLPNDIERLFPSVFEESDLGEIPKGWKTETIGCLVDTISDTYPLSSVSEVVFLNTGDILDGRFLHNDSAAVHTLPGQAKKSIRLGDVLYSEIRPENKRFAYVHFDASKYVVSTKLMVLRARPGIDPLFPYFVLTAKDKIDFLQMMAESRSGTFPQITFDVVSKIEIVLPPPQLVQHFVNTVLRPIFEKRLALDKECDVLTSIRDSLLPKLISGQITFKTAEQLIAG